MQQHLFHRCGQRIDVCETLEGSTNRFIFLDHQTGDGLQRCPKCCRTLFRSDFRCEPPTVAPAKRSPAPKSTTRIVASREAGRLISQAIGIRARRSAP